MLSIPAAACIYGSLRISLFFLQDNRSGEFLHFTRPHKDLPDEIILVWNKTKHF